MIGFSQGAAFAALLCAIVGVSFDPELIMLTAHYGWADGKAGIISVYYDRRAPSPASIVRSIQSIIKQADAVSQQVWYLRGRVQAFSPSHGLSHV